MNRQFLEDAMGHLADRHILEAAEARPRRPVLRRLAAAAAAVALLLLAAGQLLPSAAVTAYAQGTDQALTGAGVVLETGTVDDRGAQTGHPLMFYLSGAEIDHVRFSCKNQKLSFVDWTEQRDEYGLAGNFTVVYGPDTEAYYYLLIDWVPRATLEALHDPDVTIADLPEDLREDVIVLEITLAGGKEVCKAITVTLQDDGTFFAAWQDYTVTPQDTFVTRPDAPPIPRETLYGPD